MARHPLLGVALLLAAALAGCTGGGGTGTAGIQVTDAPTDDYSSVLVTFSRASIHRAGSGNESDDNGTAGWVTLAEGPKTVDLLALHRNQTAEALGFASVDAGRYTQVRLYVDRVVATKKADGSEVTMTVPSGVLRTAKSFEVRAGGNTTLTLEVDLDRSIACNPQGCRFAPVVGKVEAAER